MGVQGETALPGLTAARAIALEGIWDDGGLWEEVMWLSRQCRQGGSADQSALRWHHFVLAVGNFKRPSSLGALGDRVNQLWDQAGDLSGR